MMKNLDEDYMRLAYRLALKGRGKTSPNPMVGAVVVKRGQIIATGWHRSCGGPHAEAQALASAGQAARGATLYVTLEPCFHTGRTPPCVNAVIAAGVKRVVIGMKDPNPLTNGKSVSKLRRAGISVRVGVLKTELSEMNCAFVTAVTSGRPWVVAKIAQTLDGKVATASGQSKWITSAQSRAYAARRRNDFDAIMVGVGTVLADDPGLNASRRGKRLVKIVLDSNLRVPLKARLFSSTSPEDIVFATTVKAPKTGVKRLRARGCQVLVAPPRHARPRVGWALKELARQEVRSVLIEGGGELIGSALSEKQVDCLHCYIAPLIFGDADALTSVRGMRSCLIRDAVRLKNSRRKELGPDLFIEGDVVYR